MITNEKKEKIKKIISNLGNDLLEIAKKNNISVYESDLVNLNEPITPSGFIIKTQEGYKIFIHKGCHIHRKRFTLAHELGHFFLHKDYLNKNKLITDSDNTLYNRPGYTGLDENTKAMEQEANFFASELLMPEELVKIAYKKNCDIQFLSKGFNVSNDAMYFRLKNLNIIDGEDE